MSENPGFELDELAEIYVKRGVDKPLARQVAEQLMANDALTAHARDELGISEITAARPIQAALIGGNVLGRRRNAVAYGRRIPRQRIGACRVRGIAGLSRRLGSDRRTGGRCQHSARHHSGDLLGRVCLGADRRYRTAVRYGGLESGRPSQSVEGESAWCAQHLAIAVADSARAATRFW